MKCKHCGAELEEAMAFCCFCGSEQPLSQSPEETVAITGEPEDLTGIPSASAPEIKRKKPIGLIVAGCIAAVLTVVIVLGFCTNWFGFYGPATRIAMAAKNTGKDGNFTVVMNVKAKSPEIGPSTITGEETVIQVDIDHKEQELLLYGKSEQKYHGQTLTTYIGIIDGYLVNGIIWGNYQEYHKTDIREDLNEFFASYEDPEEIDWEELFEMIKESTQVDLNEHIDIDAFEKSIMTYFRKLNSNKWLKENAGYSTTKENGVRYYKFEPDPYQFSKASLECFRNALKKQDDYDQIMESLTSSRQEISDFDIEIVVGVQRSKLAEVELNVDADGVQIDCALEFHSYGTTEIPTHILEELLMKAG